MNNATLNTLCWIVIAVTLVLIWLTGVDVM
jgi:hypothetical protein